MSPNLRNRNLNVHTPRFPLLSFLRKQGSSSPDGAVMEALRLLMSFSVTFPGRGTSLLEPTLMVFLFLPSPVTFTAKGLPLICLSANLHDTLYSPGAVGRNETETVPSLLSWQLISALLGPSTASDRPPVVTQDERNNSSQQHYLSFLLGTRLLISCFLPL